MRLMTAQESVVGSYMQTAAVGLSFESFPPIVSSRPEMETQVVAVTGRAATLFHTPALDLNHDLQDWRRAPSEQVYIDLEPHLTDNT